MSNQMLTADEISLMMEALDALEARASRDGLLFSFMTVALAPVDEKDAVAEKAKQKLGQKDAARAALEDRIILLKAKLIQLRTTAAIDSVFQGGQE